MITCFITVFQDCVSYCELSNLPITYFVYENFQTYKIRILTYKKTRFSITPFILQPGASFKILSMMLYGFRSFNVKWISGYFVAVVRLLYGKLSTTSTSSTKLCLRCSSVFFRASVCLDEFHIGCGFFRFFRCLLMSSFVVVFR